MKPINDRHAMLFALLMLLFLSPSDMIQAVTKNCNTQQCVEVAYADANSDSKNDNVWVTPTLDAGFAYSASYADSGYGQDSKGGTPGTQVSGNRLLVNNCNYDCANQPKPCSGTPGTYGSSQNVDFNTVCVSSSPD